MIVVRAWPEHPPAGRAHVVDGWPRVRVDDFDYRGLAELPDDVISMDWDTACSPGDLHWFADHASEHPDEVLVGPCQIYRSAARPRLDAPRWNVGVVGPSGMFRPFTDGESPWAHHFGFGLVYLPRVLLARFVADCPGVPMTDGAFCDWHYRVLGLHARVDWLVHPVHLHCAEAEQGLLLENSRPAVR